VDRANLFRRKSKYCSLLSLPEGRASEPYIFVSLYYKFCINISLKGKNIIAQGFTLGMNISKKLIYPEGVEYTFRFGNYFAYGKN